MSEIEREKFKTWYAEKQTHLLLQTRTFQILFQRHRCFEEMLVEN